jgi:hypothetical protein
VLQELSIETRNSLMALGLPGWHAEFSTATETRAGTHRLGVQINIRHQTPAPEHADAACRRAAPRPSAASRLPPAPVHRAAGSIFRRMN